MAKWASMERWQLKIMQLWKVKIDSFVVIHNRGIGFVYRWNLYWHTPNLTRKMSINDFGHASWVITPPTRCSQSWRNYRLPLSTKQIAIPSLPHLENECQQSVNNIWSCFLGNHTADRLQSVIKEFSAAFISKTDCNTLPAPSWKWASTEHQPFLVMYLGLSVGQKVAHSHKWSISCLY